MWQEGVLRERSRHDSNRTDKNENQPYKSRAEKKVGHILGVSGEEITGMEIIKRSIDARKKPEIYYVYTVDVALSKTKREWSILNRGKNKNISRAEEISYTFSVCTDGNMMEQRPVVVGSGPAGLFCAYLLAKYGYRPILIEQGAPAKERRKAVETFWETGVLDIRTNVQFGEGGAGTFSDGKLNTLVKDPEGRNREVLQIFVEHGAPEEILYESKPHIGTDILIDVVQKIRKSIESYGGECRFYTKMTGIQIQDHNIVGIEIEQDGTHSLLPSQTVVLALGDSARDTFAMLKKSGVFLEAKSFAVGVRVEHLQEQINLSEYGTKQHPDLPAAAYKLTAKAGNGRGVYTFCMCPGGYVANASLRRETSVRQWNELSWKSREKCQQCGDCYSNPGRLYGGEEYSLPGSPFKENWKSGHNGGKGKIPVQCFGDFCEDKVSTGFGEILPQMKGACTFGDVRGIFPEDIAKAIQEGIQDFEHKIHGFSRNDTVLSGVEARTSSPVRITRDESMQSLGIRGLYPCGEGAGYAGGITSAAMDGIKTAEAIAKQYRPVDHDERNTVIL